MRMDPPEHTRLRRMVIPELSARAINSYRPFVSELASRLLDDISAQSGPVDLVSSFALPLPALTIARILGVPAEDVDSFEAQARIVTTCDLGLKTGADALRDLSDYLDKLVRAKESNPADDLISRLASRYVATGELDRTDLVAMVFLVLVAGHETTANQIALSVLTLIQHPQGLTTMLTRPDRMNRVIDELLRYWSIPQDNQVRVVAEETDLGGVAVCPGEAVVFALPAANHDETVFPDPARFDPDRDARHHLAFGQGPHYCPGAPLARMELELTLMALFRRFPKLRLAVDVDQLSFRRNTVVYGLDQLPVIW
jgi:cytochrome P450